MRLRTAYVEEAWKAQTKTTLLNTSAWQAGKVLAHVVWNDVVVNIAGPSRSFKLLLQVKWLSSELYSMHNRYKKLHASFTKSLRPPHHTHSNIRLSFASWHAMQLSARTKHIQVLGRVFTIVEICTEHWHDRAWQICLVSAIAMCVWSARDTEHAVLYVQAYADGHASSRT